MRIFVVAWVIVLSASFLSLSPNALAGTPEGKKKDCNEQANPKSVGIGIFGIGIGQIGSFGQGKSDEGKKECRSAKAVKTEKSAQQKK